MLIQCDLELQNADSPSLLGPTRWQIPANHQRDHSPDHASPPEDVGQNTASPSWRIKSLLARNWRINDAPMAMKNRANQSFTCHAPARDPAAQAPAAHPETIEESSSVRVERI